MREDGYINVTMLCKASGKNINKWKENKSSDQLLNTFFSLTGIQVSELLNSTRVGKTQYTFAHPDVAIQIAQWCSSSFALQVSRWTRELLLSSIRDIPIPDYETLKKQYEDCGKNMSELAKVYKRSDNALKKWFVKYEKELGITKSCIKSIKPKSSIKKPSDQELLYDRNVLKLNYTQIGLKYDVDRTTATGWILKLII
jgi:hypothetical protein